MRDVVVVGLGRIGWIHAKTYLRFAARGWLDRVWIRDPNASRVAQVTREHPALAALPMTAAWPRTLALASVCVPPADHFEVAEPLLLRGVHVLVEKPLALERAAAARLCERAEAGGGRLFTGHSERFNAGVRACFGALESPHKVVVNRHSETAPVRHSIDVVRDLMIHDLDLLIALFGEDIEAVRASGTRGPGALLDTTLAELRWRQGPRATLSARRVGESRRRDWTLRDAREGAIEVDFLRGGARRIGKEDYRLEDGLDAMEAQLATFLATRGLGQAPGGPLPLATGRDGLRALRLAERVIEATQEGARG